MILGFLAAFAAISGISYATTVGTNISTVDLSTTGNISATGNLTITGEATLGATNITPSASGLLNILTGNLKVGNGTPGVSLNGEDAYIEGTFEVDGTSQFDGNLTMNGSTTANGNTVLGSDTSDTLTVYGSTTVTISANGTLNVLTGNLKVGDGVPDVTLNAEDAYVDGTLEVDGAARFDGDLTANGSITANGNTVLGNLATADTLDLANIRLNTDLTFASGISSGADITIDASTAAVTGTDLDITGGQGGPTAGTGGKLNLTGGTGGAGGGTGGDIVLLGGTANGGTSGAVLIGSPSLTTTKATNLLGVAGPLEVDGAARFEGTSTWVLPATANIVIDAATTDSTNTSGILDIDIDSAIVSGTNSGIDLNYEIVGSTASTNNAMGITLEPKTSSGRTINGINISLTDPATSGSNRTITGLNINNFLSTGSTDTTYVAQLQGGDFLYTGRNFQQLAGTSSSAFSLRQTGQFTTTTVNDVFVSRKLAYFATPSSGIGILDISNPALPTALTGTSSMASNVAGIFVQGNYLYAAASAGGLYIIDVSNPGNSASLIQVGSFVPSGISLSGGIYISGKYAYLTDGSAGLRIVDISNPSAPAQAASINTNITGARDVYVQGRYAYVVGSNFAIVDISSPSSPSTLVATSSDGIGIYVSGKYAYVTGATQVKIFDVSDTDATPTISAAGTSASYTSISYGSIYVSGKYAYAHVGTALKVYDISNPSAGPLPLVAAYSGLATTGSVGKSKVTVVGRYGYVTCGTSCGIQIVELSGAELPTLYAGTVESNSMAVTENLNVGNDLWVKQSLHVGVGGIQVRGPLSLETGTTTAGTGPFTVNTTAGGLNISTDVAPSGSATITLNNNRIILNSSLVLATICSTPDTNTSLTVSALAGSGTATITVRNFGSGGQTADFYVCFLVID